MQIGFRRIGDRFTEVGFMIAATIGCAAATPGFAAASPASSFVCAIRAGSGAAFQRSGKLDQSRHTH